MLKKLHVIIVSVFFVGCQLTSGQECERDLDKVEEGRTCGKSCSTDEDCSGGNRECLCDDYCGKSCFNPSGKCSYLTGPDNGFVILEGTSYGDEARYSCDSGYLLVGTSSRTCRSDKNWSGNEPECLEESTCGEVQDIRSRVIAGDDAKPGAWPWQVLLFYNRDHESNRIRELNSTMGGGSIISEKWILTAAHNFDYFTSLFEDNSRWPQVFLMAVGLTEIPSQGQIIPDYIQFYEPGKIYRNPKYDDSTFDYDIALIRVGTRLKISENLFVADAGSQNGVLRFSDYIQPICLPCMSMYPYATHNLTENFAEETCSSGDWTVPSNLEPEGDNVTVTGFGYTDTSFGRSNFLQEGVLKLLSLSQCKKSFKNSAGTFTRRMLCAESAKTTVTVDACTGDSGGPLKRQYGETEQQRKPWVEIGVVSWGIGCASQYPGVYTHVAPMMSWIVEAILDATPKDDDPCECDPCQNGGVCTAEGEEFECQCVGPFVGQQCDVGWGQWTPCSKACGGGTRFKVDNCGSDISQCRKTYEDCNTEDCEPRDRCPARYSFRYNTASSCCKNSNQNCGVPEHESRTDGENTYIVKYWPWTVAVLGEGNLCTGALIHKRWVVTGGACLQGFMAYSKENVYVLLGTSSYTDPEASVQKIGVKSFILHEDYNFPVNDIGLIKLDEDASFSDVVQPICLPNGEVLDEDTTCFAIGWGYENQETQRSGNVSSLLLEAGLRILPFDSCTAAYENHFPGELNIFESQNLCVGKFAGGPEMCRDAIVSPLVCQRRDSCTWFLAGMGSAGPSTCGVPDYPGAYTKIRAFQQWIETHVPLASG